MKNFKNVMDAELEEFLESEDFYDFEKQESLENDNSRNKQYERVLKETKIFDLDRENDKQAFEMERIRLLEALFLYRKNTHVAYDRRYTYDYFSVEMVTTFDRCLNSFDPSQGTSFLNYLNHAVSVAVNRACAQIVYCDRSGGIHRSRKDLDCIRAIKKYMHENKTSEMITKDYIEDLAENLGLSYSQTSEALRDMDVLMIGDQIELGDGEVVSIFDTIAAETDIEDEYCEREKIESYLREFNKMYKTVVCPSQRYLISSLSTALFLRDIVRYNINVSSYEIILMDDVSEYRKHGTIKSQSDLAREFGVDNASINMPWKRFIAKFKRSN